MNGKHTADTNGTPSRCGWCFTTRSPQAVHRLRGLLERARADRLRGPRRSTTGRARGAGGDTLRPPARAPRARARPRGSRSRPRAAAGGARGPASAGRSSRRRVTLGPARAPPSPRTAGTAAARPRWACRDRWTAGSGACGTIRARGASPFPRARAALHPFPRAPTARHLPPTTARGRLLPPAGTTSRRGGPASSGRPVRERRPPVAPRPLTKGNAMRRPWIAGPALLGSCCWCSPSSSPRRRRRPRRQDQAGDHRQLHLLAQGHHHQEGYQGHLEEPRRPRTTSSAPTASARRPRDRAVRQSDAGPGKSWSYTFKKKGTFFYLCTFHAGMASMHGKVVVKSPPAARPPDGGSRGRTDGRLRAGRRAPRGARAASSDRPAPAD